MGVEGTELAPWELCNITNNSCYSWVMVMERTLCIQAVMSLNTSNGDGGMGWGGGGHVLNVVMEEATVTDIVWGVGWGGGLLFTQ